jgi:hypothetical protein
MTFSRDKDAPIPPTPPKLPAEPAKPVVPGAAEIPIYPQYPRFPGQPGTPSRNNQTDVPVSEVERYTVSVLEAFPDGNTENNIAITIKDAEYARYSNGTMSIKLLFKNGSEYMYYLRNPKLKAETRKDVFRETFETIVQIDKTVLLERYVSELTYTNKSIVSLSLMGNNKIVVLLNFSKRA